MELLEPLIINTLENYLKIKTTCELKVKMPFFKVLCMNQENQLRQPTIFPQVIHFHFNAKTIDFMRLISTCFLSKNEAFKTLEIGNHFSLKV